MTTAALKGVDPRARQALRRLRLQLDRLAHAPVLGAHRSTLSGRGLEFDQVVSFAYGDDVRDIDWNVTARRGDLYRKTFAEDREVAIVCVFADHPALQFGSETASKRDRLLEALSLLLLFGAEQQQRVALLHLSAEGIETMPFTRDRPRIVRQVGRLFATPAPDVAKPWPIEPPVQRLRQFGRGHLVVWFGDIPQSLPDPQWAAVTRAHAALAVRVEDPWELEGPEASMSVFDPVSGSLVEMDASRESQARRRAWRRDREEIWTAWWPRAHQRLVIDNADTTDTVVALTAFLGRRRTAHRFPAG